ncbi:FbpB family small basic protein [Bacillus lacus]|uniref:FbpB family small basic protein n=1 Tax=Metabacillus lacus TaxID=1983721 RepID=A0A7X2LYP3_9BACI|nr:FbpB family small basic protein [Metabacillus lacus]MRX72053.1 FbpB family small basic protein [Metabacillus lacus]
MRRRLRKKGFEERMEANRQMILKDEPALEEIYERIEQKHLRADEPSFSNKREQLNRQEKHFTARS